MYKRLAWKLMLIGYWRGVPLHFGAFFTLLSLSLSLFVAWNFTKKMAHNKLKGVSLVSVWDLVVATSSASAASSATVLYVCHPLCFTKFCPLIRIFHFWLCLEYLFLLSFIFLVSSVYLWFIWSLSLYSKMGSFHVLFIY